MAEKKARKLVHDSDRKKVSKKAIIISSVVAALLAIAGIVIGVLFGLGVFDKKEDKFTYFTDLANHKINTVEVLNKIENKEHVFLFVYNNNELDAKESENDTEFSDEDEEIVKQVKALALTIQEKNSKIEGNENGKKDLYYLFLVDTSIEGNETIYENSSMGSITADEDPALTYFYRGTNFTSVPEELGNKLEGHDVNDYQISYKGTNKKALIQCLKDSKSFINDLGA